MIHVHAIEAGHAAEAIHALQVHLMMHLTGTAATAAQTAHAIAAHVMHAAHLRLIHEAVVVQVMADAVLTERVHGIVTHGVAQTAHLTHGAAVAHA